MHALILANGKGTNLRPLTVYTPKSIIPIVNRPLLLFQIEILKRAGIDQITLFLDYQPGKIEQVLGNEIDLGVEVRYVVEEKPFGTAGAYKFSTKFGREKTLILNGDIFTDFVLARLLKQHEKLDSLITIATVPYVENGGTGVVSVAGNGRVLESAESLEPAENVQTNAGIYVIEPEVGDLISDDPSSMFKLDVFPDFIERDLPIFGKLLEGGYWIPLNTLESYRRIHKDFLGDEIKHLKPEANTNYERATSSFIDSTSEIGKDCVIKPSARVLNSVLGKGVQVDEGAEIENSVIWSHTRVSQGATIKDSVITSSCYIGKNSSVTNGAFLGDKSSIADYTRL